MSERETTGTSAVVKAAESAAIVLSPETVTRYVNALATQQEIALFLNQCAMFGLNPFKREIYLIKYSPKDPATFVVGYETYIKRADRSGKWAGMNSGTEDGPDGTPVKAWVEVFRKDWEKPLRHEVFFSEYVQTKPEWKDGQPTGRKIPTKFWADKPRTMLKKVAIAQAFRMAFPDEFAGMPYTAEEMPVDHAKLPTTEVVADLTDPKVDPFSKTSYEESKRRPLGRPVDEFEGSFEPGPGKGEEKGEGPSFGEEIGADTAEDHAKKSKPKKGETPTLTQLEKFAKVKTDLAARGISEEKMWVGIQRFVFKTYNRTVGELSDFNEAEMELVHGYLLRWRASLEDDEKKAAAAKGAK
jgi:phage recombination protein Bet